MGLGSAIGSAIQATGSNIDTLINAWSANVQNKKSYKYSKKLFDYQLQRNLVDAPSMQMQGYQKAGINPLLAYGSLGTNQSMPMFNAEGFTSSGGRGIAEAVATALHQRQIAKENLRADKRLEKDMQLVDAEVNSARSNAELNRANAALSLAKADKERNTTPSAKSFLEERDKSLRMIESSILKTNAERWHGMKTNFTIRTPSLASLLGVKIGATMYLGDMLDILHSTLSDEGEIRRYITENIQKGGLKKSDSKPIVKPKKVSTGSGSPQSDGYGYKDGKRGYWRGGFFYPENVWKRMKR